MNFSTLHLSPPLSYDALTPALLLPPPPRQNCATRDHTTLLLNCYTKLKQRRKLRLFIRGKLPSGDRLAQRDPSAAVAYDVPGHSLGGGFEGDEEDEEGEDGEGGGEGEGEGDAVEGGNGTDEGGADGVGDLDELDDMDEAEDEEEEDEEDEEGGGEEAKGKQQGAPTRHRRQRKLLFDVDNAIKVLRDAQYWAEALYLARREEQHSWCGVRPSPPTPGS